MRRRDSRSRKSCNTHSDGSAIPVHNQVPRDGEKDPSSPIGSWTLDE